MLTAVCRSVEKMNIDFLPFLYLYFKFLQCILTFLSNKSLKQLFVHKKLLSTSLCEDCLKHSHITTRQYCESKFSQQFQIVFKVAKTVRTLCTNFRHISRCSASIQKDHWSQKLRVLKVKERGVSGVSAGTAPARMLKLRHQ